MADRSIEDVSPSAKLVYKILEYDGGLTQKELVHRSMLAPRTVREALGTLRDIGVVTEQIYIPDARQRIYALAAEEPEPARSSAHEQDQRV